MSPIPSRARAAVLVIAAAGLLSGAPARASAPDSLVLQAPNAVKVWSVYQPGERNFVVWLTWRENADDVSTYLSPPDLAGWTPTSPPAQASRPKVRGAYNGTIDRTIVFRATRDATVGTDSVRISVEIRREEYISTTLVLTPSYVPNTWLPLRLRNQRNNQTVDFGLEVRFSAGRVDAGGTFSVAAEDFEGFHIWRGIEPDGSDLEIIGEVSKEEAFKGDKAGGSVVDSVYFDSIIPTLRQSMPWFSPFGAVACLGTRIDVPLQGNEFLWFDCNASNGFTYYYAITSFDRGYAPGSSTQGLNKVDHCRVEQGMPYACRDEMVSVEVAVDTQDVLRDVYVVPNPYRSGSSRLTSENYHNFPDGLIRFVNVPQRCNIKIFTVSGDLVWERTNVQARGNIEWDVTNRDSQPVASGVYLYRLETPDGDSVYGRIVVIR